MAISRLEVFDSLSDDYDSLIDECFYDWCNDNRIPYWSDGNEDYPDAFKIYFILNNF